MAENCEYQKRFWRELDQLKVHSFYLSKYHEKTARIDLRINVALAILSSGGICSWAIWKEVAFFSGIVIAITQLVNSVKHYFPYKKRLISLQNAASEIECLFISMESRWHDISEGKLDISEINDLQMNFKKKSQAIKDKNFKNNPLPLDDKVMGVAKLLAKQYFDNFYPEG